MNVAAESVRQQIGIHCDDTIQHCLLIGGYIEPVSSGCRSTVNGGYDQRRGDTRRAQPGNLSNRFTLRQSFRTDPRLFRDALPFLNLCLDKCRVLVGRIADRIGATLE